MKAIFILAGHGKGSDGSPDPGAVGNGTTERNEVILIARKVHEILQDQVGRSIPTGVAIVSLGIEEDMSVAEKTSQVNSVCHSQGWYRQDCLLCEVHLNTDGDATANGGETWYKGGDNTTKTLAQQIVDAMCAEAGFNNRGVHDDTTNRWGRLGIVRDTTPIAALVEAGFISGDHDFPIINDDAGRTKIATGIAKGILANMGLQLIVTQIPDWYTDVPAQAWYAPELKLCVQSGEFIIPPDGRFNPTTDRITLAVVMGRHLKNQHGL